MRQCVPEVLETCWTIICFCTMQLFFFSLSAAVFFFRLNTIRKHNTEKHHELFCHFEMYGCGMWIDIQLLTAWRNIMQSLLPCTPSICMRVTPTFSQADLKAGGQAATGMAPTFDHRADLSRYCWNHAVFYSLNRSFWMKMEEKSRITYAEVPGSQLNSDRFIWNVPLILVMQLVSDPVH